MSNPTLEQLVQNVTNLTPDAAMELLLDYVEAAKQNKDQRKRILILAGPYGSGKTSIAREVYTRITGKQDYSMLTTEYNVLAAAEKNSVVLIDNHDTFLNPTVARKTATALAHNVVAYRPLYKHMSDVREVGPTYIIVTSLEENVPEDIESDRAYILTLKRYTND